MISYHTCPLASEEGKETGGMNVYVYELSCALSKLGYEVDVVTRSQDAHVEKIVQVDKRFRVIHLVAGPEHPQPRKKVIDFVPEFIESLKVFIKKEYALMKSADIITSPSKSDKLYLMYLYEATQEKIVEIAPGVNMNLFRPMNKEEAKSHLNISTARKTLLFVGRIEPLKGIDMLLYAVKILKTQLPSVPFALLIVGGDISQHITK